MRREPRRTGLFLVAILAWLAVFAPLQLSGQRTSARVELHRATAAGTPQAAREQKGRAGLHLDSGKTRHSGCTPFVPAARISTDPAFTECSRIVAGRFRGSHSSPLIIRAGRSPPYQTIAA